MPLRSNSHLGLRLYPLGWTEQLFLKIQNWNHSIETGGPRADFDLWLYLVWTVTCFKRISIRCQHWKVETLLIVFLKKKSVHMACQQLMEISRLWREMLQFPPSTLYSIELYAWSSGAFGFGIHYLNKFLCDMVWVLHFPQWVAVSLSTCMGVWS